ncbi:mitochondrial import receptor subunit TOM22 homolog [Acanthaster planci]|uniref:Mitochondrial import receptor subunit TOM22 homolog n=1 Tax=Acanthaster planci TaxID=133434 RepID=A0A8B7YSM0_ACAPL|nr:mitochondrial import receptor subunit TOM22 homolog [Acanthaster planci]
MAESGKSSKAVTFVDDDDFEDETLAERLYGLTEMFPESVRNGASALTSASLKGVKLSYNFSRSALWILSTSFMVLMLPVIFETEIAQMEQAQLQKQRQILLGPNAAMSGAGGLPGGMTPPIAAMPR